MVREAERYEEGERQRRESAALRDGAHQLVHGTEKFVQDHENTMRGDNKSEVEASVGGLKEALKNGDDAAVREAMERVAIALRNLHG